jgi:hypothetical protein
VSYFTDEFIPSRTRVFQRLFSENQWILRLRKLILGETIRFGVNFQDGEKSAKYTLLEGPDGSLKVFDGLNDLDFRVFRIPLNLVIKVDEKHLREWVENEEKMMKHPLFYFFYYMLRVLPKLRFN